MRKGGLCRTSSLIPHPSSLVPHPGARIEHPLSLLACRTRHPRAVSSTARGHRPHPSPGTHAVGWRCSRIQADVKEGSHPMQGLCYLALAVGLLALAAGAVFFGKARRHQSAAAAERDQIARLREESVKESEARKREAIIE